jgi:hypothetical protein
MELQSDSQLGQMLSNACLKNWWYIIGNEGEPVKQWLGCYTCSEGQEKYLREISITPVGYFMGAIKNHSCGMSHRNYFAW